MSHRAPPIIYVPLQVDHDGPQRSRWLPVPDAVWWLGWDVHQLRRCAAAATLQPGCGQGDATGGVRLL